MLVNTDATPLVFVGETGGRRLIVTAFVSKGALLPPVAVAMVWQRTCLPDCAFVKASVLAVAPAMEVNVTPSADSCHW